MPRLGYSDKLSRIGDAPEVSARSSNALFRYSLSSRGTRPAPFFLPLTRAESNRLMPLFRLPSNSTLFFKFIKIFVLNINDFHIEFNI